MVLRLLRGYYTRWEIGGEPQLPVLTSVHPLIIPDGRSGGNRNHPHELQPFFVLYPMGDRGGTATDFFGRPPRFDYTRWEIGGEPQLPGRGRAASRDYTRWEIGGEPQQYRQPLLGCLNYTRWEIGGEPQQSATYCFRPSYYTRWEIGGEPQPYSARPLRPGYYTRWEIGGEPQLGHPSSLGG